MCAKRRVRRRNFQPVEVGYLPYFGTDLRNCPQAQHESVSICACVSSTAKPSFSAGHGLPIMVELMSVTSNEAVHTFGAALFRSSR